MSTAARTLLLVNRLPRNLQLLADFLAKEGYLTISAATYEEIDRVLANLPPLAGALVDITGFDVEVWARCEQLRAAKIPFLVVSPRQSAAIEHASFSHGAKGVMVKPLVVKELIGVIRSILEE